MSAVQPVTDATFEREVLRSELPVLVDFYADWCQPCRALAPVVAEVARELSGRLKVVKVDTDRNPRVAAAFGIQSIPTLVVMSGGQVVAHHVGALDRKGLLRLVEAALPRNDAEVKPSELAELIRQRRAVPVDVRDAASYRRHRIPTALHIPAADVETRISELRSLDGRIRVLYGRSTDEARELAERLASRGVRVGYLAGGLLHWEADGLPVERPA